MSTAKDDVERIKNILGYIAAEGAKTIGAEALRGAFYALMINELYPVIKEKLVGTKKGGVKDEGIIMKGILEELGKKDLSTQSELFKRALQEILIKNPELVSAKKPIEIKELSPEVKAEQDALIDKINRLYKVMNDLAEKYYKGDLKEEEYLKKKTEIEREIDSTRERLARIKSVFQ